MPKVDETLYSEAKLFLEQRFGLTPWKGVAAMYTESGKILLSTAPDFPNESVSLCHETGAFCEAHKISEKITASICISRDDKGDIHVLSPCGVCQERLFQYGPEVSIAIPDPSNSKTWQAKPLKDLQPYYWRNQFM